VSDRLEELRRQRGLLRSHLDWLDREIASLAGAAPAAPPPPAAAPPARPPPEPRAADAEAEAILAEYRLPAVSIQKQARVGCLLYFAAAITLMVLAVGALYLILRRAHGH